MNPRNEATSITLRIRLLSRCDILAFVALAFLVFGSDVSEAGSPIGELSYRYPCTVDRRTVEITYEFRRDPATVGVQLGNRGIPVLW